MSSERWGDALATVPELERIASLQVKMASLLESYSKKEKNT